MRNDTLVESKEYKGYTIEIHVDQDPTNPRDDCKIGTIVASHRRYDFDESDVRFDDYGSWKEVEKMLRKERKALFVYPLYMFEHSGIKLQLHPFGDRWDSGQLGLFYFTAEDLKELGLKKTAKAKIDKHAESLIEEYSYYVNGEVYGYVVKDKDGEVEESVWGFTGPYYPEKEAYIYQEAKSVVDHLRERWHKKQVGKGFFRPAKSGEDEGHYNPPLDWGERQRARKLIKANMALSKRFARRGGKHMAEWTAARAGGIQAALEYFGGRDHKPRRK